MLWWCSYHLKEQGLNGTIMSLMYNDPIMARAALEAHQRVLKPRYLNDLLSENRDEKEYYLSVIHSGFPKYKFDPQIFKDNQKKYRI